MRRRDALELRIPPPVVMLVTGLLMWLVALAAPALTVGFPGAPVVAGCIAATGLFMAGVAVLSNIAALVLLPVFVAYINRFQISPEERALARVFPAEFDAYRRRVRRWV